MQLQDIPLSHTEVQKIRQHLAQPRPCLLCGASPAAAVGVFIPDTPATWGGKPGKVRILGYALCRLCLDVPDRTTRVEWRLMIATGKDGDASHC